MFTSFVAGNWAPYCSYLISLAIGQSIDTSIVIDCHRLLSIIIKWIKIDENPAIELKFC